MNDLEQAIHAGSTKDVIAALRAMAPPERAACAPSIRRLQKHNADRGDVDKHNLAVAMFVVGDAQERAASWAYSDLMERHLDLLDPQVLRGLAADVVAGYPASGNRAQRLVAQGISDRPDSDAYIVGLMGIVPFHMYQQDRIRKLVADDPGLLDGTLLRLFDMCGDDLICLERSDKHVSGGSSWNDVLLELTAAGKLARPTMIEKSLAALENDWPQMQSRWYSHFYGALAPTPDEMAPHAARYLRLCESRLSPNVTLALDALGHLARMGVVDPAALADALAPVMLSAAKGQVEAALKLLDHAVKAAPGLAHAAASHAARALAHSSSDLHKKIIARLALWGFDEPTRAGLLEMLPQVAAVQRDALAALAGAAPASIAAPAPELAGTGPLSPLDPSRRLAPLDDPDALIQVIASFFENDGMIDDLERVLDALARMAPGLAAERARFSPVLKRARTIAAGKREMAAALAGVLLFAFKPGELAEAADEDWAVAELSRRLLDLRALIATGTGLVALSNATHMRGFIDPAILVERIGEHAARGVTASMGEQVRALLRLAPGPAPSALSRARAMAQTPFLQALRYALGDAVDIGEQRPLFAAAARIRHPEADDVAMLAAYGDLGPDGPALARYEWKLWRGFAVDVSPAPVDVLPGLTAVRRHIGQSGRFCHFYGDRAVKLYAASILPSSLEKFFNKGAYEVGNNLDWRSQNWDDEVYIGMLIDPTVPASPGAIMLLAFALGAKEAGQVALAVDALVAMTLEGRVESVPVGAAIRWVLLSTLGKASRYAKSLAAAALAHPSMPAAVVAVLCEILDIKDAAPPNDTAALLALLLELSVANRLPPGALDRIGQLTLTGKAKAAQKELLARS
jgi:hypothetical protein